MSEKRDALNRIYEPLSLRLQELMAGLKMCGEFKLSSGFYNNHSYKNEAGEYVADCFPIPVVSVEGLCDIEIDIEGISITSKLTKENALTFDCSKVQCSRLEIYGVEDYLTDYYASGDNLQDALQKIKECSELELFYSFYYSESVETKAICEAVKCLRENNFFY